MSVFSPGTGERWGKPVPSIQVIAEIGSVHDGSFGNAIRLIDLAADCGADVVKFQTHIARAETLPDAPMPPYFKGEPRFEYFERTAFGKEQWIALREHAHACGLQFCSSPFSEEAVDLLQGVGIDSFKIPSGEVTNIALLEKVARTGRPVILSSGMSDWKELDAAVEIFKARGCELSVLQCSTAYPCPYAQVGLNVIGEMRERYGCPVGFSDHTATIFAPIAAAALGAAVIEKHLTFSRRMYGSDAANALEPSDFRAMVDGVRAVEEMSAHSVDKSDATPYAEMKRIFEKSIVSITTIVAGTTITADMVGIKKPGGGIAPSRLREVVGKKAKRDIPADRQIAENDLS